MRYRVFELYLFFFLDLYYVCDRIGREELQATYSINLPPPEEWESPDKAPTPYDLLQAYGGKFSFLDEAHYVMPW